MPQGWRFTDRQVRCDCCPPLFLTPDGQDASDYSYSETVAAAYSPFAALPFTTTTPAAVHLVNSRRRLLLRHKSHRRGRAQATLHPGQTVHQSPALVPSLMPTLTKPLPHRSFSNSLVHYHFVYNLPSYIGLMNGSRNNGVDNVNRLALPMAPPLRHPPRIHTTRPFPSPFNRARGRAHSISSGGVGDAPCAILRRKQRIAAYGDYLKQACVRDVERAVNAERAGLRDTCRRLNGGYCEDVGRGWEVATVHDEGESEKVGCASGSHDLKSATATSKAMRRLKSELEKVREKAGRVKQKTDQIKVKCSKMTGKFADKMKMKLKLGRRTESVPAF